jgi:hypothetical protein
MKGVYAVSAIFALVWVLLWLNHRFWSRFPSDELTGEIIIKALSQSPRWAAVQDGLDWPAKWQETRTTNVVKIRPKGKTVKAGRFSQ